MVDGARRIGVRPVVVASALAMLWSVLAMWHPTITYHFGPTLVAASIPLFVRIRDRPWPSRLALLPATSGLLVAAVTTVALTLADALRGPVIVGGNATVEAALFATVGAAWGWSTLRRARQGLIVRAFTERET